MGQEDLIFQILGYFLAHPEASETLEGIDNWRWLEDTSGKSADERVEPALDALLARGFLIATRTSGKGRVYRLNRSQREEAERLVGLVREVSLSRI
jgi:DNA-binding PadR family transcriptional regulator